MQSKDLSIYTFPNVKRNGLNSFMQSVPYWISSKFKVNTGDLQFHI